MARQRCNFRYGARIDIGYARVSTAKQELTRHLDALAAAGVDPAHIHVDKKSGATMAHPGLQSALTHARAGDVLVVQTLDRLGRAVQNTLILVHELEGRGVGGRTLADPYAIDSAEPDGPMSQPAFVMLALPRQTERTYSAERAARGRWPRPTDRTAIRGRC